MKLFVWEELFKDYSPGLAVVLAETEEQARMLLFEKMKQYLQREPYVGDDYMFDDVAKGPTRTLELDSPIAFFVDGGG